MQSPQGKFGLLIDANETSFSAFAQTILDDANAAAVRATIAAQGNITGITVKSTAETGTYTPPAGTKKLLVIVIGAGGGGGGSSQGIGQSGFAEGGQGGGFSMKLYTSLAASYGYTVGAKGTGGSAGANNGNDGNPSSFNTTQIGCAGKGGLAGTATGTNGTIRRGTTKNSSSGGDVNGDSKLGGPGLCLVAASSLGMSGDGGSSWLGGGPLGLIATGNGSNAATPGAGGSGGKSDAGGANKAGGDGADGIIIIYEFS